MSKTNFMLFSNYKKTTNINVNINDIDNEMVYVSKFLGVLIDNISLTGKIMSAL